MDDYLTVNAHADYLFEGGFAEETRVRFGIRNLFDEEPPLAAPRYFGLRRKFSYNQ